MTTSDRTFRRLRAQFQKELLGDTKPTPSDKTLIEQAALASMRSRELRDEIVSGKIVGDNDFVRIVRATVAVMKAFRSRSTTTAKPKGSLLQRKLAGEGKPS